MHITVLGASRFGVATVRNLIDDGHEVVLIDLDRDRLDSLADGLDCAMIVGDGTLPSTLRDAYGDGSDALVALTNEDDVNILAAVVARAVGYERVIPQITRSELLSVVEELELDDAITPHESLARSIVAGLTQHTEVETDVALQRDLRMVNQRVPASLDGTRLGDLELTENMKPVAHSNKDKESFTSPDLTLHEGDRLIFVVRSEEAEQLAHIFEPD